MKIIAPPYLQKEDTIGIVCPAGFMAMDKVIKCMSTLQEWGYRIKLGNTVGSNSQTYFSGTDEERLADLQAMLDDDEVKAVMCARGGYGMSRIIDKIKFKKFKKNPKWVIGYSDITVFHSHVYSNYGISGMHAPMAAAFNSEVIPGTDEVEAYATATKNEFILSLKNALEGQALDYRCHPHEFNRAGEGSGELVGGNLALLSHLVGSDSDIKTKKRILFIEDIGEYLYNIDRMMLQLKRSGKLSRLSGLIVGGFTDIKDTDRPFGKTVYEIIRDAVAEYNYPVCYGFPVSHSTENYALKIGVQCKIVVDSNGGRLTEMPESKKDMV